jgi:uncharacterized protein (DUF305 family)
MPARKFVIAAAVASVALVVGFCGTSSAAVHNNADVNFAQMMTAHHQQGVELCDIVLAKQGIDPRVVAIVTQEKDGQTRDIDEMQTWLRQWGVTATPQTAMAQMPGMRSPQDLDALRAAQGVDASRLFLTQMIPHHQGGLTMAQKEVDNGQSGDAIALAHAILSTQQHEIDQMNDLLSSLS